MSRTPSEHALAAVRNALEMNQQQFANVAGCSVDSIKSIESGRMNLSEKLAQRIAAETGVDLGWLLENKADKLPIPTALEAMPKTRDGLLAWEAVHYDRSIFERIQAAKGLDGLTDAQSVFVNQLKLSMEIDKLLGAYIAAEKAGPQKGAILAFRLREFVAGLNAEFGDGLTPELKDHPSHQVLTDGLRDLLREAVPNLVPV